jgi:hypothetical protein
MRGGAHAACGMQARMPLRHRLEQFFDAHVLPHGKQFELDGFRRQE